MTQSIRAIARLAAIPGKENDLKKILLDLIEPTRAEAGCLRYELLQSEVTPHLFVFWEEWSSEAAMNEHLSSAHVQEALLEGQEFLDGPPEIHKYKLLA